MYALADQGYITSQGKGYFATYGTPEDLVEEASAEAEPEEFVLPDDFGDQIVDLVSSQPRMHVGEITRHFFEERLQTEEFAKVRELFFDLCASGRLINLGAGYYKAPGQIVTEPQHDYAHRKNLDQMLREAGIRGGGGGFKPNKRSRRR